MSRKHHSRGAKHAQKHVSTVTEAAMTRLSEAIPDRQEFERMGDRAAERLSTVSQRGVEQARRGLKSAASMAKDHPAAAASVLVGAGVLVGAVAHRAFTREPTLGELLLRSLGEQLEKLNKTAQLAAKAGLHLAAGPLRRALR